MKRLLDEDLRLNDFRDFVGGVKARNNENCWVILLAALSFLAAVAAVTYAVVRLCRASDSYDFADIGDGEEPLYDEDGCCYTDEEDFVE